MNKLQDYALPAAIITFLVAVVLFFGSAVVDCNRSGGEMMKTMWNTYKCVKVDK